MTKLNLNLVWLRDVPGLDRLTNTICSVSDPDRQQTRMMILFPGDVMTETGKMPVQFGQFSFENAAMAILEHDHSVGSVSVIKPANHCGDTACFTNFVDVTPGGNPAVYHPNGHATEHLYKLVDNIRAKLHMNAMPRIVLAGFSRGGVVVNQIITELAGAKNDEFWSKVDEVRWIDTGNSPGIGAFPLDETAAKKFAEMARSHPIRILIAGSPFQWKNPFRPNILVERQRFVEILRQYVSHPHLVVRYHFADHGSNLDDHFAMLVDHLFPDNGVDISAGV